MWCIIQIDLEKYTMGVEDKQLNHRVRGEQ
jgi:hypothetical protein